MEHVETAELADGRPDRCLQAVGVGHVGADRNRLVPSEMSGFFARPASISAMATFAPSPANKIAVARPMPLPAPVMKTTCLQALASISPSRSQI